MSDLFPSAINRPRRASRACARCPVPCRGRPRRPSGPRAAPSREAPMPARDPGSPSGPRGARRRAGGALPVELLPRPASSRARRTAPSCAPTSRDGSRQRVAATVSIASKPGGSRSAPSAPGGSGSKLPAAATAASVPITRRIVASVGACGRAPQDGRSAPVQLPECFSIGTGLLQDTLPEPRGGREQRVERFALVPVELVDGPGGHRRPTAAGELLRGIALPRCAQLGGESVPLRDEARERPRVERGRLCWPSAMEPPRALPGFWRLR